MTDDERKKLDKENFHRVFQDRVNELCEERGYTKYVLSSNSSVPMSTLMHLLDGSSTNPSLYNIVKICEGLDVTLAEFFDTEEFELVVIESGNEE